MRGWTVNIHHPRGKPNGIGLFLGGVRENDPLGLLKLEGKSESQNSRTQYSHMLFFSPQAELLLKHLTPDYRLIFYHSVGSLPHAQREHPSPFGILSFPHSPSLSFRLDTQTTFRSDLLTTQELRTEMERSMCRVQWQSSEYRREWTSSQMTARKSGRW